ncbi:DUF2955 domain-containing protein [Algoriphagus namhaensis]
MTALSLEQRQKKIDIFRYGVGATLTLYLAATFGGFLGYLIPVMTIPLLAAKKELSIAGGILFVLVIALAVLCADLILILFGESLLMLIPALFLAIFHIFYTRSKFITPELKALLLICVMMIPNIGVKSEFLAKEISLSLIVVAIQSVIAVWVMYFLFPAKAEPTKKSSQPVQDLRNVQKDFREALTKTLVLLPLLLLFYFKNLTGSLLLLIYVGLLAMQTGFGEGFAKGKPLILGNLAGGILAILCYELLSVVPHQLFYVLLLLLISLFIGSNLFSSSPIAPLYGMAFSTFLLIIGSTTSGGDTDAETKVWVRVTQVMMAVIYIAFTFGLIDKLRKETREK